MKRGDIVIAAFKGDYGKPRPALVMQADLFIPHPSVSVLPITSDCRDTPALRINIDAHPATGLREPSQIMIVKCQTITCERVSRVVGAVGRDTMTAVNSAFAVFFGLAERQA